MLTAVALHQGKLAYCVEAILFATLRVEGSLQECADGRRTFFSEILGILQIIPNIIPNLGILGRVPSEPSMLGGVPNADRNIPFRAFIQCSVGARTDTIIK